MRCTSALAVIVICLMCGFAASGRAQDGVSKDLAPFQGMWVIQSINGVKPPKAVYIVLTIDGDQYTTKANGQLEERGTLTIDATKKPASIDMRIAEGPSANSVQVGVVRLERDTLTYKLSAPGAKDRPADFKVQRGSDVIVAKKYKPGTALH